MVMVINAIVDRADYDTMVRSYWRREAIEANIEVDGLLHPGGQIAFWDTASLNYPKKSLQLTFRRSHLLQGRLQRLNLSADYVDKSLIRQRLSFDLLSQTGLAAPQAWPVDLTILDQNSQPLARGLYTAIEPIDAWFFRSRGREIGALYKAQGSLVNGVFEGADLTPQPDTVLRRIYAKKSSPKVVATGFVADLLKRLFNWSRLEIDDSDDEDYSDLTRFILTLNSPQAGNLETLLDINRYLDWLAANSLLQHNHAYRQNYYLHRRPEDDIWEILPAGASLTWGRTWAEPCGSLCDDLPGDTPLKGAEQMANQLSRRVLNTPNYFDQFRARLAQLLETAFNKETLFDKIESYTAEIRELAHQDTGKWPSNKEFEAEAERLKSWIRQRRRFLYKALKGPLAAAATLPDTIVTAAGFNKQPLVAGDDLIFQATIHNVGSAPTGPTVGVAFLVDDQYITFGASGRLEAGAERRITAISPWQATPGDHTLTALVDDVNRYPELSETNNILNVEFTVVEPPPPTLSDVIVKDIAFERTEAGQIRLAALVSNVGSAPTADVVGVAFFVDDGYATFGVIGPMPPGATQPIRAAQPLPLIGRRKITAIVDDINRFPEQSEANNSRVEIIDFGSPPPRLADAVILGLSLGSAGAGRFTQGDALTFEAQVKNIGAAPTGDVVGVAFLLDGQYVTFGTTAPIAPDETRLVRAVSPWQATTGRHRLLAVVDDINRFPELSESNNRFELTFEVFQREEVKLPDSTLDSLDFETTDNGDIVLTAVVSNIGTAPTPDLVGVAFFVDDRYVTFGTTAPMPTGATQTVRAVQPLPLNGSHVVTAIVDDVNRYDELSHQNNRLSRTLNFQPRRLTERRAVWLSRYDWTQLGKAPPPEALDEVVMRVAEAGFNTIFFQVRGRGDAYYTPGLEPWAARLTGSVWETQGQHPGWDPLARILETAHPLGLEVHAYINVYSIWVAPPNENYGQLAPPATTPPHLFDRLTYGPGHAEHPGQHGLGMAWRQHDAPDQPMPLAWGKPLWASPGVDAVRDHTVAVAADIVRRYPVDGLHLDLVRYANRPYSFDPASNAAAGSAKTPARDQWQRDRITDLVRRIQTQANSVRPGVWISAAVWPFYQNKWGWRISQGYHDFYQDSKGWLAAGVVDAISPMMYGSVSDELDKWQILMEDFLADSQGRHVYPGIGADYEDFSAIAQRIDAARKANAPGHAIFSYRALLNRGYLAALASGPYAKPARLPIHPTRQAAT